MWIEALRSVPSSLSSSVGARAETAPRVVVSCQADSTSSTAKAMSWTPSPCSRTCSAISPSGRQRRREHEPDVVLDHDVARPVADLGLEAAERDRREAPQRAVVGRGLAGVADPELDVVDALERQEVGRLVVGVLVDPGARLVGGAASRWSPSSRISPAAAGRPVAAEPRRPVVVASDATPRVRHWAHGRHPARTTPGGPRRAGARRDRRSRPARRGRWPRSTTTRTRPAGDRARSSPTSPRWRSTGWARSSASWTATPEPVPFGRIATDAVRIGLVGRDRSLPPRELYDRIDDALTAVRSTLADADPGRARAARAPPEARRDDRRADARPVHRRPPRGPRRPARDDPRGPDRRRLTRDPAGTCSSCTRSRSGSSSGCSPAADSSAWPSCGCAGCR